MSITMNVASSNPAQARCTRYNIINLSVICGMWVVSSTNKTDDHNILVTEILFKVALNTINLNKTDNISACQKNSDKILYFCVYGG